MKAKGLVQTCLMVGIILSVSCNNGNKKQENSGETEQSITEATTEAKNDLATEKPYPWNFPEGIPLELELGQYVLSIHTFYPDKIVNSKDPVNEVYIFYNATVDSVGRDKSKINGVVMPNSLIMPIPKAQKVKNGDIVLTWWQGGSGLQRAIIKDASNPEEPIADFLDLKYDDTKDDCMAIKFGNRKLKPNSFVKLEDGKWQPGMPVAYRVDGRWNKGTIINTSGDKVLILGFAGKIKTSNKSVCKLIPINGDFKKGDSVSAIFVGRFRDGYTVEKIDKAIGRVWVKRDNKVETLSILEVAKNL